MSPALVVRILMLRCSAVIHDRFSQLIDDNFRTKVHILVRKRTIGRQVRCSLVQHAFCQSSLPDLTEVHEGWCTPHPCAAQVGFVF